MELRRVVGVGSGTVEFTSTGMEFEGVDGEAKEILERIKEDGVPIRGGGRSDGIQYETIDLVPSTFYTADDVIDLLRGSGVTVDELPSRGQERRGL